MNGSSPTGTNVSAVVTGQTVRARNPLLPPLQTETVRVAVPSPPPVPVEPFHPAPSSVAPPPDVPVLRSETPTLPEDVAELPLPPLPPRCEPSAVAGEVSVTEPEPLGMFDPRPVRVGRPSTEPTKRAAPSRLDPQPVSGEMAVVSSRGPEPVPPSPAGLRVSMPGGSRRRVGTDPGGMAGGFYSDTTGPQPLAQGETTVPQSVMQPFAPQRRSDRTLWYVALALVVLAVAGVTFVVSRAL